MKLLSYTATYMRAACDALKTNARGDAITGEAFVQHALIEGLSKLPTRKKMLLCESCAKEAYLVVPALAKLLASEIEKAIEQVSRVCRPE